MRLRKDGQSKVCCLLIAHLVVKQALRGMLVGIYAFWIRITSRPPLPVRHKQT